MEFKEALIYIAVALSSLIMISYVVHMFVGGLVSGRVEIAIMVTADILWAGLIGVLAWDVVRRRRGQ